jgi:uncharacterized protein (TIGR03435 family)
MALNRKEITMRRVMASAGLLAAMVWGMYGQESGNAPEFEAASVKPTSQPDPSAMMGGGMVRIRMGCSGGPGTDDPGRFTCNAMNLHTLMTQAWGVDSYQITGPSTLDNERFDIAAKIPEGTTKEQFRFMLQKLLTDRFHLVMHHEQREQSVYLLNIGKNGHKLQTPKEGDTETAMEAMTKGRDGDGVNPEMMKRMTIGGGGPDSGQIRMMVTNAGGSGGGGGRMGGHIATSMVNGQARMIGRRATMTDLVRQLSQQLDRPVLDQTGLAGEWNFTVDFAAESLGGRGGAGMMVAMQAAAQMQGSTGGGGNVKTDASEPANAASLPNALDKQLGLKLESKKAPADTIVVDKLEKVPTEN